MLAEHAQEVTGPEAHQCAEWSIAEAGWTTRPPRRARALLRQGAPLKFTIFRTNIILLWNRFHEEHNHLNDTSIIFLK